MPERSAAAVAGGQRPRLPVDAAAVAAGGLQPADASVELAIDTAARMASDRERRAAARAQAGDGRSR
jgi:hypothetical protein